MTSLVSLQSLGMPRLRVRMVGNRFRIWSERRDSFNVEVVKKVSCVGFIRNVIENASFKEWSDDLAIEATSVSLVILLMITNYVCPNVTIELKWNRIVLNYNILKLRSCAAGILKIPVFTNFEQEAGVCSIKRNEQHVDYQLVHVALLQ